MSHRNARTAPAARKRPAGQAHARAQAPRSFVEQYRGLLLAAVVVAIVIALGVIFVLKFGPTNAGREAAAGAQPVDPAVFTAVTQVPAAVYDTVGLGSAGNGPKPIVGAPPLQAGGKPEVLYIGAEYCPYCAAERWAVIAALSRFGTFSNLHTLRSSTSDVFPGTATFTFVGSSFDSQYVNLMAVEQYTNQPAAGNGYTKLQDLSSDQQAVMDKYDNQGGIPFVDFGGKYSFSGATYGPGVLSGMDWQQIAAKLSDPSTTQAQGILGSANLISATVCQLTNQQPAAVCGSAGVQKAAAQLGKG